LTPRTRQAQKRSAKGGRKDGARPAPTREALYQAVPVTPVLPSRAPAAPGAAAGALQGILQRVPHESHVQRAAQSAAGEGLQPIDSDVAGQIESARGAGRPLAGGVQRSMGQAFGGVDFSGVRVHTGRQATGLSNRLQAKAFTTGRDVFFNDRAYDPGSREGQAVLAHELTHTIQQGAVGGGSNSGAVQRMPANAVQRLSMHDMPWPDVSPAPNRTMKKSDGGQGGVYFVDEGNESVVIKLDEPQKAFGAQVSNQFTAISTGLQTSDFRIFAPGSGGEQAIKNEIVAHTTTDQRPDLGNRPVNGRLLADGAMDAADDSTAVILMEKIQNVSLDDMAKDPAMHNDLITALTNPSVVNGMAKLIVSDAIMGNADRFMKDMDPESATVGMPANISNIFLSPDFQNVIAMDNESLRSGNFNHGAKNPEAEFKKKMGNVRALLNPAFCTDIAEMVICAVLFTTGDMQAPQGGVNADLPRDFHLNFIPPTGKLGALHHKIVQGKVRDRMAAILASALPGAVETVVKTMRQQNKALRSSYKSALADASDGANGFKNAAGKLRAGKETVDYNVLRSRAKFLNVARKEKDSAKAETKGISAALKHLKHKEKKEAKKR
jgi:hypothetical protein